MCKPVYGATSTLYGLLALFHDDSAEGEVHFHDGWKAIL